MNLDLLTAQFAAVLFAAAPLILAALGETVAERAGVINLSLDGTIVLAAMAALPQRRYRQGADLGRQRRHRSQQHSSGGDAVVL